MRSRASDSRLWIGRRRRRETSRRQFESARGYPSHAARIDHAFGMTANRKGRRPTELHVPDLKSAAMVDSESLMGADQVFVSADLEVHPLRIPAQDLSYPFGHYCRRANSLVRRLVEKTQPADQHVRNCHRHLFIHRDVHLRPRVRSRREDSFSGGRCAEEPPDLLRRVATLEMKSGLLVETKARELVERTQWRAERTIPCGARPRAAESECEEPADLFGHAPMRRQLAARHR